MWNLYIHPQLMEGNCVTTLKGKLVKSIDAKEGIKVSFLVFHL